MEQFDAFDLESSRFSKEHIGSDDYTPIYAIFFSVPELEKIIDSAVNRRIQELLKSRQLERRERTAKAV